MVTKLVYYLITRFMWTGKPLGDTRLTMIVINLVSIVLNFAEWIINQKQTYKLSKTEIELNERYRSWHRNFAENEKRLQLIESRLQNIAANKPYFIAEPTSTILKDKKYLMKINLRNIGNGPAVTVCLDDRDKGMQGYIYGDMKKRFSILGVPSVTNNAVPVNHITSLYVSCEQSDFPCNKTDSGKIEFILFYEDLMDRQFKQHFIIHWFYNCNIQNINFTKQIINDEPLLINT